MRCCPDDFPDFPFNLFQERKKTCFPPPLCRRRGSTAFLNPDSVKNVHKNAKSIMPIWIDGVQVTAGKSCGISKNVFASWTLSHVHPTGFRIGGSYQRPINDSILGTPFVEVELNPWSLSTNLHFKQNLFSNILIDAEVQMKPTQILKSTLSFEHYGKDKSTTVTFYELGRKSGTMTIAPLYKLSKNWSFGTELMLKWNKKLVEKQVAAIIKYSTKDIVTAATCSHKALNFTYWQRIDDKLQIGSAFGINSDNKRYKTSFFYQWNGKDVQIRGLCDTDCSVGFTYLKYLSPVPSSITLSLFYCIPTSKFGCGFKFDLNSNLL